MQSALVSPDLLLCKKVARRQLRGFLASKMRAPQRSRWEHDPSYGPGQSVRSLGSTCSAISRDSSPAERVGFIAQQPREALAATVKLYERTGFVRPWISYLATSGPLIAVGICGFAAPPKSSRVEITYSRL